MFAEMAMVGRSAKLYGLDHQRHAGPILAEHEAREASASYSAELEPHESPPDLKPGWS